VLIKQRIQKNVRVGMALVVAIALLVIAQSPLASAQTANTLKVSPVRTDIEILPGGSKTVQITVTNVTNESIIVRPSINDFVSGDESGTPALILDETKYAASHSLKRFITPLNNVTIPAGQAKTINVLVTVPAEVKAGGYYGAVRFAPASPDEGGQVNLSASVASLILLTVPGDTSERLDLTSFTVRQDGKSNTLFNTSKGLVATFRFENKGDSQMGPFGKISVKQGDDVVYQTDFNNKNPRDLILPEGARVWDVPLDKIGDFGHYSVVATFTYGAKNQTVETIASFWVIPTWLIIAGIVLVVVLLAVIVLIVFLIIRKSKKPKTSRSRGRGSYRR